MNQTQLHMVSLAVHLTQTMLDSLGVYLIQMMLDSLGLHLRLFNRYHHSLLWLVPFLPLLYIFW